MEDEVSTALHTEVEEELLELFLSDSGVGVVADGSLPLPAPKLLSSDLDLLDGGGRQDGNEEVANRLAETHGEPVLGFSLG